jgi:HPt (histidine-containing phosphotransfer) domain-containing protein
MQTQALNNVLEHLRVTFNFDKDETKKLLKMLHKTLTESISTLRGEQSENIYHTSHKLHSELHMCGYEDLSELAATIELQAKKGIIERVLIDDFLSQSKSFASEIEEWLLRGN